MGIMVLFEVNRPLGTSCVVDEFIGSCWPGFESLRTDGGALNTFLYFQLCYQLIALLLYGVTILFGYFLETGNDPDHHLGLRYYRAPSAALSFQWCQQGRKKVKVHFLSLHTPKIFGNHTTVFACHPVESADAISPVCSKIALLVWVYATGLLDE